MVVTEQLDKILLLISSKVHIVIYFWQKQVEIIPIESYIKGETLLRIVLLVHVFMLLLKNLYRPNLGEEYRT